MSEITLIVNSREGIKKIPLEVNRLTIGRSDEAALVIDDGGLSRLHASINRDGERIWVLDEASTNGTFVNDVEVPPQGTPLQDGDEISIGNETTITVSFDAPAAKVATTSRAFALADAAAGAAPGQEAAARASNSSWQAPYIIAVVGIIVILLAAAGIASLAGRSVERDGNQDRITARPNPRGDDDGGDDDSDARASSNSTKTTTANAGRSPAPNSSSVSESDTTSHAADMDQARAPVSGKLYLEMSKEEQIKFIEYHAQHVARMIGNRDGYAFPPAVIGQIKIWVDAYARRLKSPKPGGGCNMRHDLRTLLERGKTHAPLIIKSFNGKGLSAQVGLYLAIIESEYCPCLSSGTGAKGMFQFVGTTARLYGVPFVTNPSRDPAPDDRCKEEIMAPIAAEYMKDLISRFGTGPLSVPLAIASYNSGEGGLDKNLLTALDAARNSENPERSFWTLVAHSESLSTQFQRENIKYVPHFFGAAIVGENPQTFGVPLQPLSSYTQ